MVDSDVFKLLLKFCSVSLISCLQETENISLSLPSLTSARKLWTFPLLFGFWLISVQQTQTEAEMELSKSHLTAVPGNLNVSPV